MYNEKAMPPPFKDVSQSTFLERSIVGVFSSIFFLLPLFVFPFSGTSIGLWKNIFLSVSVFLVLLLSLRFWFERKAVFLPVQTVFLSLGAIALVSLFSSAFSGSFQSSFFGAGMSPRAAVEILFFVLLTILAAAFFRTKQDLERVVTLLFVAALSILSFQAFRILSPEHLTFFGFFTSPEQNVVGKWNDLGLFCGLVFILALATVSLRRPIRDRERRITYAAGLFSFFGSLLSLERIEWVVLFLTLFFGFHILFQRKPKGERAQNGSSKNWSRKTFLFGLYFVAATVLLSPMIQRALLPRLDIPLSHASPTLSETVDVLRGTFRASGGGALLGSGTNRFGIAWQKYRPRSANLGPWWNTDFQNGTTWFLTFAVETGILGILSLAVFFMIFLLLGWRVLTSPFRRADEEARALSLCLFFGALYLWAVCFVSVPGAVLFALAFLLTGLFLGSLYLGGVMHFLEYPFPKNRHSFAPVFFAVLLLVLTAGGYKLARSYASVFAYREAIALAHQGQVDASRERFQKALSLMESDVYSRDFSILETYRLRQLLEQEDIAPDDLRLKFRETFQSALDLAKTSIARDPENYVNYVAYGNILAFVIPFDIVGLSNDAYKGAKGAYEKAAVLSPNNPEVFSGLARISLAYGSTDEAKSYLKKAVELKPDYTESSLLLTEIEMKAGDTQSAQEILSQALAADSSSPILLFQLGFLKYRNGGYSEAILLLEKAASVERDYSNAKYILGLSYYRVGRRADAVKEIEAVASMNPDNVEAARVLNDLRSGRDPVSGDLLPDPASYGAGIITTPPLAFPMM